MTASLAVQKAVRARLVASNGVTSLVPEENILDTNQRPAPSPSILLGEAQDVDANRTLARDFTSVFLTMHIWQREPSLVGVKMIAGAVRRALGRLTRLDLDDEDFVCCDFRFESARFLRDPDGEMAHGVVTFVALIQERWSVEI
ncbi:MAG: DUF3168 domain-containing protein [Hyphomicrobiaceae bacterium]